MHTRSAHVCESKTLETSKKAERRLLPERCRWPSQRRRRLPGAVAAAVARDTSSYSMAAAVPAAKDTAAADAAAATVRSSHGDPVLDLVPAAPAPAPAESNVDGGYGWVVVMVSFLQHAVIVGLNYSNGVVFDVCAHLHIACCPCAACAAAAHTSTAATA
jgi:hypothetical protein